MRDPSSKGTWYHEAMLIVANWKSYVDRPQDAKKLLATAKRLSLSVKKARIVLAPSAPFLAMLAVGNRSKVAFAGQDVSTSSVGAATGETSADALRGIGAKYAIVGHSERRAMGETDAIVAEKAKRALINRLTPILCVGETERDQDARYLSGIREQIASVYKGLEARERLEIVIAYEPVWAIGKQASDALPAHDVAEMVLYIRKILSEYLPDKAAAKTRILYGGSVEPANIRELATGSGVDGFLVGHASAEPTSFAALVKAIA